MKNQINLNPLGALLIYMILLATYSFLIGAIMDAFLPLNIVTLTIARIILASSAIMYYIAFVLPNFIKKAFLKKA